MIEMIDSIESPETTGKPIPDAILHAPAIAAYIAGNSWPTWTPYVHARPDLYVEGKIVSVTLTWNAHARCYDIEDGGGVNANIGRFMEMADRTFGLPWLYTFASNGEAMLHAAESQGYHHGRDYYYWSAHPNSEHGKHLCSPRLCGYPKADCTQYDFNVPGNCDASTCSDYVFPGEIVTPTEDEMITVAQNQNGRLEVFVKLATGEVKHIAQEVANGDWWKDDSGRFRWLSLGNPGK